MLRLLAPVLFAAVPLALLVSACSEQPTDPGEQFEEPDDKKPMLPLGVYEITLTGISGADITGSSRELSPVLPGGVSGVMNTVSSGISLEFVSSTSQIDGVRNQDGHRYITATYRVRNTSGVNRSNLTYIPVINGASINNTGFSTLLLFNNTAAPAALASQFVPTGAVAVAPDGQLRSS